MRKFLVLTLFSVAILMPLPKVLACGGVEQFYPLIEGITRYDLIVAATVQEYDDVGIGTILKVDRYFKGTGGEYVVLMPYPPALQNAGYTRRYDTGCLYAARSGGRWQHNGYGYMTLSANGNGTYSSGRIYFPKDGLVEFYSRDTDKYGEEVTLPVHKFEKLVLDLIGESETTEPTSSQYPLMRYLNVTTESGERYRLNPDRSVTWLDRAKYPIAISNDGSHVMFQLDHGELGFQYLAILKKPYDPWLHAVGSATSGGGSYMSEGQFASDGWLHPVKGFFGEFSPNSDFVAVQEATHLTVYLLFSVSKEGAVAGFGHIMALRAIATTTIDWPATGREMPLKWSEDSQTIAYQDVQGIWLWKMLEDTEPQLVIPTDESQALLDLSYSGRYIRFGNDASWTLLDIQTGESWKNMLISPDESRRIEIRIELADDDANETAVVTQYKLCSEPLSRCPLVIRAAPPRFIFWHDPGFVGLAYSTSFESFPWRYSLDNVCCSGIGGSDLPSISAFAFDETYMQPAFAFDTTHIGLDFDGWYYYDSIDLSEHLDSPIVDLEWGQPIFYDGR